MTEHLGSASHSESATPLYRTIVADPPWPMPSGGPRTAWTDPKRRVPFPTMALHEIAALPVAGLAQTDAHLYLWTVNTYLEHAWDIVRGWGFKPSQMLVWAKTPRGVGFGGAFTNSAEFVLFARRGSLAPKQRLDTTWWHWSRTNENGTVKHSRKPEAFLDIVESVSPGPYLELFARRQRLGWDTWGNEALEHVELEIST